MVMWNMKGQSVSREREREKIRRLRKKYERPAPRTKREDEEGRKRNFSMKKDWLRLSPRIRSSPPSLCRRWRKMKVESHRFWVLTSNSGSLLFSSFFSSSSRFARNLVRWYFWWRPRFLFWNAADEETMQQRSVDKDAILSILTFGIELSARVCAWCARV